MLAVGIVEKDSEGAAVTAKGKYPWVRLIELLSLPLGIGVVVTVPQVGVCTITAKVTKHLTATIEVGTSINRDGDMVLTVYLRETGKYTPTVGQFTPLGEVADYGK